MQLTARQFLLYFKQVGKIEARRQLYSFEASALPYMKEGDRIRLVEIYQPSVDGEARVERSWEILRGRKHVKSR